MPEKGRREPQHAAPRAPNLHGAAMEGVGAEMG